MRQDKENLNKRDKELNEIEPIEEPIDEPIEETEAIKPPAEKRGDSIPDEEDAPGMHPHHHLHY